MNESRFDNLLQGYQTGEASPAEVAELAGLLRGDARLRTAFVESILLEVHLRKAFCHESFALPAPSRSARRSWRTPAWLAAAAVLLAGGISLWLLLGRRPEPITSGKPEPANEVQSGQVKIAGVLATRIPQGALVEVAGSQPAAIRLTDGSRVELTPASKAVIQGQRGEARQTIELVQGSGKFQVTRGEGRFRVQTPVGTVVALGTAFQVNLRPAVKAAQGKAGVLMAVTVTEGTVQVNTGKKSYQLAVGRQRLFDNDGEHNNKDDGEQHNNNHDDGNK